MKALLLRQGGSIDYLQIEDVEIPKINKDELLIKVHAVSLNPSDYQTIEFIKDVPIPIVLGLDIAGEVVQIGDHVKDFKVGDRVFYLREITNPNGGFAQYSVTPAKFACKIPEDLDYVQAAALPGAGMTAYHIIYDRFKIKKDRNILIHGGAGGVGSYLIQMAKLNGLKVLTTCLKRDFDYVKALGADIAIDFQNEAVYPRVLQETHQKGVDYIVNMIGSQSASADFEIMNFGCEIAVTAGLPDFKKWKFYDKGISMHEIAFGAYLTYPDIEVQKIPAQTAHHLSLLVASGKIKIPHIQTIKLEDIPSALYQIKEGKSHGKIVAKIQ